jgi:adenosine receptor A2a
MSEFENATSLSEFESFSSFGNGSGFEYASMLSNCSSNYSNADSGEQLPELNVTYTLLEGLVAFFAVIGNALVIIVFYRERRLRRRTNYYIISLATADFLVGLLGK